MKSLKFILPVGLCAMLVSGFAARNFRQEAERQLKVEETVTGAKNRQILSEQKAWEDFQKRRQQAREDFEFKRRLGLME